MGLIISVYRNADLRFGDCTNGGISSRAAELCLVNVDGPFDPRPGLPAAILQSHHKGILRIVPAELDESTGRWSVAPGWFMMGGNYGATSDSRFYDACQRLTGARFYGAVPIHDRQE